MLKKASLLSRPTLARQDAPFRRHGRRRVKTALRVGRSPVQ